MTFKQFIKDELGHFLFVVGFGTAILLSLFIGSFAIMLLFNLTFDSAWLISCLIAMFIMVPVLIYMSYSKWKTKQSIVTEHKSPEMPDANMSVQKVPEAVLGVPSGGSQDNSCVEKDGGQK